MNKERKRNIQKIITQLNGCKSDIENINSNLESINFDEEYARNNTPENLQGSNAYCKSEDCSDKIGDAISDLTDAISDLQSAVNYLEEI